jgi:predicted HicB family RNase H-like nuclease
MTEERAPYGYPPKQLNIRLPENLHRELKAKCALEGESVAATIEGLVRSYLAGKAQPFKPGE